MAIARAKMEVAGMLSTVTVSVPQAVTVNHLFLTLVSVILLVKSFSAALA